MARSSNKYLLFSFASSLPRECAPRRQSLEACCQKPPTPSQLLPTPPKEMVPAASPKSSPPQGQVSVRSSVTALWGGGKTSQEVCGEHGQGQEEARGGGDAAEVQTLVVSSPCLTDSAAGSPEQTAANRWRYSTRAGERTLKLMGLSSSA